LADDMIAIIKMGIDGEGQIFLLATDH